MLRSAQLRWKRTATREAQAMAEDHVNLEQERALARLKCAHCQSLINCEELAQAILAELHRRYRVDCLRRSDGGPDVIDLELIEAVREGIDRFLRGRSASADGDESRPSERKEIVDVPRNDPDTSQKVLAMVERSDRAGRTGGGRVVRI
jgi:hypothetical protein